METQYVYDREDIIMELDADSKMNARYIHGLGIDEPLALEKGGRFYYYQVDELGSVRALSNGMGMTLQRCAYDSFGDGDCYSTWFTPQIRQPYRFTGREWDEETGLYYYRARYYDPKVGRFLNKDPIGFAGGDVNLFRYVQNNPTNRIDPLGLYGWEVHYYKSYIWAREAGFDHVTAAAIAQANQGTDENIFTHPWSPLEWLAHGGQPGSHFPYRSHTELELMKSTKLKMIQQFGRALHALQDSFVHQGISPLKHARLGSAPDEYCKDNIRDQEMENLTRWWLSEFKKSLETKAFRY